MYIQFGITITRLARTMMACNYKNTGNTKASPKSELLIRLPRVGLHRLQCHYLYASHVFRHHPWTALRERSKCLFLICFEQLHSSNASFCILLQTVGERSTTSMVNWLHDEGVSLTCSVEAAVLFSEKLLITTQTNSQQPVCRRETLGGSKHCRNTLWRTVSDCEFLSNPHFRAVH